jgi:hypothetical protein
MSCYVNDKTDMNSTGSCYTCTTTITILYIMSSSNQFISHLGRITSPANWQTMAFFISWWPQLGTLQMENSNYSLPINWIRKKISIWNEQARGWSPPYIDRPIILKAAQNREGIAVKYSHNCVVIRAHQMDCTTAIKLKVQGKDQT